MLAEAVRVLLERSNLPPEVRDEAFSELLDGEPSPEVVSSFLTALRLRGETAADLASWVRLAQSRMLRFEVDAVGAFDPCGTGGDGQRTFNISTAVALVIAATGQPVVKHGNRGFSSPSGSSDVLEALGIAVDVTPETMQQCFRATGFAYCHAPRYHPALRRVAAVRRALGIRTFLNLAGPLLNPAAVPVQLIGVGSPAQQRTLAATAALLGTGRRAVLHSDDGFDELSPSAGSTVLLVEKGQTTEVRWSPEDFGLAGSASPPPPVHNAAESAACIEAVLSGTAPAAAAWVVINAGAALHLARRTSTLAEGASLVDQALRRGQALNLLRDLRKVLPFRA